MQTSRRRAARPRQLGAGRRRLGSSGTTRKRGFPIQSGKFLDELSHLETARGGGGAGRSGRRDGRGGGQPESNVRTQVGRLPGRAGIETAAAKSHSRERAGRPLYSP